MPYMLETRCEDTEITYMIFMYAISLYTVISISLDKSNFFLFNPNPNPMTLEYAKLLSSPLAPQPQ